MSEHLGKHVQIVGRNGKRLTVLLAYWDEASQTYEGPGFFKGTIKVPVKGGTEGLAGFFEGLQFGATEMVIMPVLWMKGLRPYPYAERPDYAWQFVMLGEDVTPLLNIGTANAGHPADTVSSGGNAPAEHPSESDADGKRPIHPADIDGDHVIHPKERKQWNREHPDDKVEEGPY